MDMEKVINGLREMSCRATWEDIDRIRDKFQPIINDAIALLKEQQPKTGHWIKKMPIYPSAIAMGGSRTSACDLCGGWGRKSFKYCPNCGAKMKEPTSTKRSEAE